AAGRARVLDAAVGVPSQVLGAIDSGWWDKTGAHGASNDNYVTGENNRDFFVFDLGGVAETGVAAQIRAQTPSNGYISPDPTETLALFDVSTPLANLRADGSG